MHYRISAGHLRTLLHRFVGSPRSSRTENLILWLRGAKQDSQFAFVACLRGPKNCPPASAKQFPPPPKSPRCPKTAECCVDVSISANSFSRMADGLRHLFPKIGMTTREMVIKVFFSDYRLKCRRKLRFFWVKCLSY